MIPNGARRAAESSKITTRPKILFVHPDLYGFGGAEIHCIRAMEHVQKIGGDITLVHAGGPFDGARLEQWSGVKLNPEATRFISVPGARLIRLFLGKLALFEFALANRWARSMAHRFDLVATLYAECTISHPCVVQYIAYPVFGSDPLSLQHLGAYRPGWRYFVRYLYQEFCKLLAGWDTDVIRSHATFTNSKWTAAQFKRLFGSDASVEAVYPGASVAIGPGSPDYIPFADRENNFAMIGRVVPGKRVEMGVEIVRRLRERGHTVGLVIIGRATGLYAQKLRRLIAGKPWIRWYDNLGRAELERLVAKQKWGLHCFPFEHYGSAPAELQALGCITFVPKDGGQIEIIDDPALQFEDCDDAVAKINRVLSKKNIHSQLVSESYRRSRHHRAERFAERYQQIVQSALKASPHPPNDLSKRG